MEESHRRHNRTFVVSSTGSHSDRELLAEVHQRGHPLRRDHPPAREAAQRGGPEEIAERTLECRYRHVPAAVPGIVSRFTIARA
jgi:hypothetical protein